jgi:hypothetical protein
MGGIWEGPMDTSLHPPRSLASLGMTAPPNDRCETAKKRAIRHLYAGPAALAFRIRAALGAD